MSCFRRFVFCCAAVVFASIALAAPAFAQVTTGTITGRVSDTQGRVVPGATVTVTNKGTGQARSTNTSDSGDYTIAEVPAGKYDVTVAAHKG